jgi:hypothetical protein
MVRWFAAYNSCQSAGSRNSSQDAALTAPIQNSLTSHTRPITESNMSTSFNPTNPNAIPRRRSHHVRIRPRNMQVCSTKPTSPRAHGPWAQTVLDILYLTPSLAFWLNNQLEHIPLNLLAAAHQSCNICYIRMCDDIHPLERSVIQTPPPLPRAPTSPGKLKRLPNRVSTRFWYVRSPNMPSALPPPMGDNICPDLAVCSIRSES